MLTKIIALKKITVIGGGSWATALVKIFSESKVAVHWYIRSEEQVQYLTGHGRNSNYLSFLQLDMDYVQPTADLEEAILSSDDILFAVPSAFLEAELAPLEANLLHEKKLYVSIKGIVSVDLLIPSVFLGRRFGLPAKDIVVLAGPCHAEEVAMDRKTYLTIAGNDKEQLQRMAAVVTSPYLKIVLNDDPAGVEYAAILKNVVGITSGMVKGMNYGDNFLAVVISNAMREVQEFLQAVDDRPRDLFDSSYFGDLLVTAYSSFSRNGSFGQMIGRGYSVALAESRMNMIAEGFPAVNGIMNMAVRLGLQLPVISTVYRVLYKHASPYTEFKLLENQLR